MKSPVCLDIWMNEVSKLNIKEFNSFIKGLKRDLDAKKNAQNQLTVKRTVFALTFTNRRINCIIRRYL